MMDFMREGGFNMWLILVAFCATFGYAMNRPKDERAFVFGVGTIFLLIAGMMGMATGMVAVAHNYDKFGDKTAAIATGLGELSNNGSFAAALATICGIAALVTRRRARREA